MEEYSGSLSDFGSKTLAKDLRMVVQQWGSLHTSLGKAVHLQSYGSSAVQQLIQLRPTASHNLYINNQKVGSLWFWSWHDCRCQTGWLFEYFRSWWFPGVSTQNSRYSLLINKETTSSESRKANPNPWNVKPWGGWATSQTIASGSSPVGQEQKAENEVGTDSQILDGWNWKNLAWSDEIGLC